MKEIKEGRHLLGHVLKCLNNNELMFIMHLTSYQQVLDYSGLIGRL